MDGSKVGELEYENFNAAGAKITFKGKSVHPGYAKGKMINSMLIANEFINALPMTKHLRKQKDMKVLSCASLIRKH
jgi:di/tripeptidase